MTISVKACNIFFLIYAETKIFPRGKPAHFTEKHKSKWHLGGKSVFYQRASLATAEYLLHWFHRSWA